MSIRMDAAIAAHYKEDSDTGIFFQRQLEFLKARAYETIFASTKAMQLIPVSFEVPEGAKTIIWELFSEVGFAKLLAASGDDIPRVDVNVQEFTSPVKGGGAGFGISIDDIAAAQMAGVPLNARKATAATRAFTRLVNRIAWNGDVATGLPGFLSNTNVSTGTVPAGVGGTVWTLKTPLEIVSDLNLVTTAPINASRGELMPDTILLPVAAHALAATTPMSVDNDKTILQFFLASNPWITSIETLVELSATGNTVASLTTDAIVAYKRDPEFLTLEIPKMFRFEPVERRNLEFITNGHGKTGGVIIYQPLSIAIYQGIDAT